MTNAYVNASENHNKRCTIYYLMSKKEYEKALEILLKNKNTSNEKFVKRQLLDFIIECADSTGNQKVINEFLEE